MNERNIVPGLLAWFGHNARDLPWRRTEDPYAIWVSEIMLQQTQVKTVLPYWERWMRELPDLRALARAKPERLHKLWEGLGYYTRVRNLQRAARLIGERHGGHFPADFDALLDLPGIGRYTAGAICSIAFNQPKPILDGNVIRVLARVYGVAGNPREPKTNAHFWRIAEELVRRAARAEGRQKKSSGAIVAAPRRSSGTGAGACSSINQSLMELGALICTPRAPRCGVCPIVKHCIAHGEDRILELPRLSRPARATPRRFVAFVVVKGGRFLVRQRPTGVINAELWEFPNLELLPDDGDLHQAACRVLNVRPKRLELIGTVKHSITRYRISLEAYRVTHEKGQEIRLDGARWLDRKRLGEVAFTSAHRSILRRLQS